MLDKVTAYSCNPHMDNPYCSCKLTRSTASPASHSNRETAHTSFTLAGLHALADCLPHCGESRPTAAVPMENPYCSCKLTREACDQG